MWQGDGHYEANMNRCIWKSYENHIENEKLVSGLVAEQSCFDISNECQDKEYSLVNA